jgi:hypothetical protein
MCETIRYAWTKTSLGDLVAAVSSKGLVALEFASNRTAAEDALRTRFPSAALIESPQDLADFLAALERAVEEPGFDPAVPLDLRGTPYEIGVWSMLRTLPAGETTSWRPGGEARQPRRARGDGGDRPQSDCRPRALPPRHQERRVDFRLPLGRQAQTRTAGA